MQYTDKDEQRRTPLEDSDLPSESYRTEWRRDFGRLVHCPAFRRLQGKTQLFPEVESDFFRNRLTHSLEVAQIAKAIAIRINHLLEEDGKEQYKIEPDIVEFAGLAHDLGHPPFGHIGEEALDKLMINSGGFEGNAQTLRILSTLEKRQNTQDNRYGLNLTYRSLASILKYDKCIPQCENARPSENILQPGGHHKPMKGYYLSDDSIVQEIKKHVTGDEHFEGEIQTIECQIMDLADDIAYSTYDLEDSFKANFLKPTDIIFADDNLLEKVRAKVNNSLNSSLALDEIRTIINSIFSSLLDITITVSEGLKSPTKEIGLMFSQALNDASKSLAENGYDRANFTSKLVGRFIRAVEIDKNDDKYPALSRIKVSLDQKLEIEVLKHFVFESQIASSKLKIVAKRGVDIIDAIFEALAKDEGFELLPKDFRDLYESEDNFSVKDRIVCDFISGMTDNYAIEFYARLKSENPQSIFKPI